MGSQITNKKNTVWVCLAASLLLGVFLWWQSDAPPYAHPVAEFNNNWWGPLASMAYKWRHMTLDFWDLGIAGGCSLYIMGRYPIFNVFNAAAWVLDDSWLLLFMFIVPYVIGFFFMLLLLLEVFGLTLLYAVFGGLIYLGMTICIHTALLEQPIFLFGNFLFPAMVYVYLKTKEQSVYRKAMFVGSMVAVQFAFAGIIQYFQVLIWWLLYFFVDFVLSLKVDPLSQTKKWVTASVLLVAMAFTISGVQFIPTLYYALTGAGRIPSETYYPINNFPLSEITDHLTKAFFSSGILSGKILSALVLVCLALATVNYRQLVKVFSRHPFILRGWLAIILYLLTPTLAGLLTSVVPQLSAVLSPLRTFTFKYGLHMLDFFIVLTLCLILSNENFKVFRLASTARNAAVWIFLAFAGLFVTIPILFLVPSVKPFLISCPILSGFEPTRPWAALLVFVMGIFLISSFALRPNNKFLAVVFAVALIALGFTRAVTSFHHQEKGKRMDVSLFHDATPEIQFYHSAKNKFLIPYDYYPLASFNYNLVYGVHGTMGSETLSPIRFNRFAALFNGQENTHLLAPGYLHISRPTSALTTYFPVDFTTIAKDEALPWRDFRRTVSGEYFDIWTRKGETKQIEFASALSCLSFQEIVDQLTNTPFNGRISVREEDCRELNISAKKLASGRLKARYLNYNRRRGDHIQFLVQTPRDTFVMLKDMYQAGWEGRVDVGSTPARKLEFFPAHYLFIGFELPPGEHAIQFRFTPPLLYEGLLINLLSLCVLLLAIVKGRTLKG